MTDRFYDRTTAAVMTTLARHADAEHSIAETLRGKQPSAVALIGMHEDEALCYELLRAEVATGLLDRLKAGVL